MNCQCGCGLPAPIAPQTIGRKGIVKGQVLRYRHGHNAGRPLPERFWEKVDKRGPDECWPWTGAGNHRGYGHIVVDGRKRPAHQVAWELEHGASFPDGMFGCHHCDNPPCVNPAHIFPGTQVENMQDASRKGRVVARGRAHWTHCPKGHPFDEANTIRGRDGSRECRTCRRARQVANRGRDVENWLRLRED